MVSKLILSVFLLALSWSGTAQLLELHSLRKLPSDINSIAEESLPLLSPDGNKLFFTRALYAANEGGKFSGQDAWVSEATAGKWTSPRNTLPVDINNEGHNAVIGMSNDGSKIYYMSALTNAPMHGIYVTSRIQNYWTRPEFIHVPGIDNQKFLGVFVSPDFEVILISMKAPDSHGEEDLYFSVKDQFGNWSKPRNMGATINTQGFEISPFLSADKKRLYFASSGHGGEGDADIFYCDRLYNSWETWSLPVNLGKAVNSNKFDAYFSIYGDSVAYFSSNRSGKFTDIYTVEVTRARTVLAEGQRYLSSAEWNRSLGGAVANTLVFPSSSTTLTPAQQELLFYIANKLQLDKGILFHLVVKEEDTPARTQARLEAVSKHLVQSGIGEERIIIEQVDPIEQSNQGRVEIRLIE